jgi:2-polyprenyl-6-methoxyphenol hydroxylase-like FAD-dependent oxidoreductase
VFNEFDSARRAQPVSTATNTKRASSSLDETPVLIVGGGPVGLTLALTLAQQGVAAILVERNPSTTTHPKMDITNGRSMELFRHLGVADELRKVAVPEDHPFDVSWVTKLDGWELARFRYPTPAQRRALIHGCNVGTMAQEPAMRVSQALLEPALKNLLESRAPQIDIRFGWALHTFAQDADGVDAVIRCTATGETRAIRAHFLAGCDGAGSAVRTGLGIGLDDIDPRRLAVRGLGLGRLLPAAIRAYLSDRERPMDGRIFLIHFTSPNRELFERFGTAWHTQSPEGWTLISQNDRDTWTLHTPLGVGTDADAIDPKQFLSTKLGVEFDCEIICANARRPRLSLAAKYGNGRVWLAGDSAHQVVPAGGYGMNTGVGDAVGLGWMLAAILQGWGEHGLRQRGTHWCAWRSKPSTAKRFTARAGTANAAAGAWVERSSIWAISKTKPTESNSDTDTTTLRSSATNHTQLQPITCTPTHLAPNPGRVRPACSSTTARRSSTYSGSASPCCGSPTSTSTPWRPPQLTAESH